MRAFIGLVYHINISADRFESLQILLALHYMVIMIHTKRYKTYMKTIIISALAISTLNACKNSSIESVSAETQIITTIGNADIPEHHMTIFAAFERLDGSAENYIQASQILDQFGAKPMSEDNDKAKHWYNLAVSIDASIAEKYPPFRGRVKGPAYREHKLAAGQIDIISEVFYAAEPAQLSVRTRQGAVTMHVKINDEETPVCHIEANSQANSCAWTPLYTTPYEIMLTNTSDSDVLFVLVSN